MDYDDALQQAMALGRNKHPNAPAEHHAAFANSVAYAVTGFSGGYGGPSMREHWCSRLIHQKGMPGQIGFDEAVGICEQVCYGPLTKEIAQMLDIEHCFDDAPGEQQQAQQMIQGSSRP